MPSNARTLHAGGVAVWLTSRVMAAQSEKASSPISLRPEPKVKHSSAAQPEKAESKTKEQKRAEAEERNRLYRAKKDFVARLKKCEEEIAAGEARKEEINGLLCSQEVLSDSGRIQELMIELKEKENSLKALYDEWEELSLRIEEIK